MAVHRGAFSQFLFRWNHYCHSSKTTIKETGKTHLCAVQRRADRPIVRWPIKVNRDMEYVWLKLGFFQLLN